MKENLRLDLSPEEKLEAIINKAEANGFKFRNETQIDSIEYKGYGRFIISLTIYKGEKDDQEDGEKTESKGTFEFHMIELFFNHNFAKAFFGTYEVCNVCGHQLKSDDWKNHQCTNCSSSLNNEENVIECWKYHLQKLVLEDNVDDIFKYLLSFVNN